MSTNAETIESYLLRLIEDVAVVKTRLDNLDNLSNKMETVLDKMDKQAIKMETATMEINALKREVEELDKRINKLEDSMHDDVKDENKSHKNLWFTIAGSVIGAIILYILNIN